MKARTETTIKVILELSEEEAGWLRNFCDWPHIEEKESPENTNIRLGIHELLNNNLPKKSDAHIIAKPNSFLDCSVFPIPNGGNLG